MAFDADGFLKTAPTHPGVYIMRNDEGEIIYVGKAKNLKNRLSSYFKSKQLLPKTAVLVSNIASIETTITGTENEALLLESNLIKQHRPRYNVRLIDDKSYPYIFLSDHSFPRFSFYRGTRKRKGRFFGPFPSSGAVKETLNLMKKVFKVRQCDDSFFSNRTRPCLQYQINRCSGPCVDKISRSAYADDVADAVLFLEGKSQVLIERLGQSMALFSRNLQFEEAAKVRDQIQYIHEIQGSNIIEGTHESLDLMALYEEAEITAVEVMTVRDGRVLGTRAYFPMVPEDTEESEIITSFIMQYYGPHRMPPGNIVINCALEADESEWLQNALGEVAERKITLQHRVRQQKLRWLEMTENNAKQSVAVKLAGRATIEHRLEALEALLGFEEPLKRIECFDISHSFGERTVASNVVYTDEGFTKKFYRRYNISGIEPGDDYAAMKQALTRRFKREEDQFPDLLIVDGGKGQLQMALETFAELGVANVALISVSEAEGKKRGFDTIWLSDKHQIEVDPTTPAFHLITQIRDEAHRFAIEGHRAQRDKLRRRSVLENIPGIGEKRRTALLTHFGGLDALKKASIEDIAKVPGIHLTLAETLYRALHEGNRS